MQLKDVVACPVCNAQPFELPLCGECGAKFSGTGGIPNLIPDAARRTFELNFDISRSTVPQDKVGRLVNYPPRHGESGDAPHRMDIAFVDVIEAMPRGSRILEIGCGGGQLREWVRSRGYEYIGTDVSSEPYEDFLKSYGGPDVFCDAHFLPFADAQFDLVYSSAVNEHLACPHLAALETRRVLKPGGFFVGSGSFLEPWHDSSFFHMSPLGVVELLEMTGFEVRHVWPGWNGFKAILSMSGPHSRKVTFLGDVMHSYYRAGNALRYMVKSLLGREVEPEILSTSVVAGALDWIAVRPLEQQGV